MALSTRAHARLWHAGGLRAGLAAELPVRWADKPEWRPMIPSEMSKLLERVAAGSTVANAIFGAAYLDGAGVAQDYEKALHHLRLASERGAPRAMFNLGRMYEQGLGVQQDRNEAARLFLASAERGEFLACVHYARWCVLTGRDEEARVWYQRADDQRGRIDELLPELLEAFGVLEARLMRNAPAPPAGATSREAESLQRPNKGFQGVAADEDP